MESPLVSIIIPTYNRAHIIGATLESILAQSHPNWECIVVDDGSTDNSAAVMENWMERDDRFKYLHRPSQMPKGPNSCRNHGYVHCKGDYVQWFDSDDLYKPDALEKYLMHFKADTDAVVAKLERVDMDSGKKIDENNIESQDVLKDYILGNITYYVSGPMWRKSFLEKQPELFDEHIRNMDDWDFNLRMLYGKPELAYISEPLISYRIHENSLFKELDKINKTEIVSDINARKKHISLLKKNGLVPAGVLEKFVAQRYFKFLRRALFTKGGHAWYLLRKSVVAHLKIKDFKTAVKIIVGFISYRLFKKGYSLLKKQ